jgi:serine/threonine-protein kinase HipA
MRVAIVYRNGQTAGKLAITNANFYIFRYDDSYFLDASKRSICLSLPKNVQEYRSKTLFPFFQNLMTEGENRTLQYNEHQIPIDDFFSLLLATAGSNTIGAVTLRSTG